MNLEDQIYKDLKDRKEVDIEKALLAYSGVHDEQAINDYKSKLDRIDKQIEDYIDSKGIKLNEQEKVAKAIYEFLRKDKKEWYTNCERSSYIDFVIDRQSAKDPEAPVGNCVGMTTLYCLLASRFGIETKVIRDGSHIACKVLVPSKFGKKTIYVENTLKSNKGFGHKDNINLYECGEHALLSTLLINRAMHRSFGKNYLAKLDDETKANEIMPDDPITLTNMSYTLEKLGFLEEAVEAAEKGTRCKVQMRLAYDMNGRLNMKRKDFAKAIENYSKAISLDKKNPHLYFKKALARLELKDFKGVVKDSTKGLKLDPYNISGLCNRGLAYTELKDYASAEKDFYDISLLESTNESAKYMLMELCYKQGKIDKAKEHLDDLIEEHPDNADYRRLKAKMEKSEPKIVPKGKRLSLKHA